MSIFGTSPDTPAAGNLKSSLFDEDTVSRSRQSGGGGGLFDEGDGGAGDSPWNFQPTPKKQARANLIRNLLSSTAVPESYIDAFDAMLDSDDRAGPNVSFEGIAKLLRSSGLSSVEQENVVKIVTPEGVSDGLGRPEFNVLMALIGLAQEGEEASLDGVDERRKRLPVPSLPGIPLKRPNTPPRTSPPKTMKSPPAAQPQAIGKQSFAADADADPWGSPVHRSNPQAEPPTYRTPTATAAAAATNGRSVIQNAAASLVGGAGRTTSTFTTTDEDVSGSAPGGAAGGAGGGWGGGGFGSGGFGLGDDQPGDDDAPGGGGQPPSRSRKTTSRQSQSLDELVTITALPDKEGRFLFQYRNYEVTSTRRNSKVVRRYSDFVWLLDCLHKKYPFRQLPLLPPKRVAINGRHLATDDGFIEKRRRGLARFANALVRHPVLNQEQLVVMFLTVPTELSVWRKQATITVQEEFTGKPLPQGLEESLPITLESLFDTVRAGVRRSAEVYIALCALLERIIKRKEGIAAEYSRFSTTFTSATETSDNTYKIDTNDVPLLNEGIAITSKHISTSHSLLLDEARAWDEGVLEDFKSHRDSLVAMRDMFDRKDRFAKDNIPALEKRIAGNEGKLAAVRAKPEGARKVGEAEKLEEAIMKDKEGIVAQHARGVFIKECVRDEIRNFQSSQYHVSRMCQEWSQDRVKYAELQADNWRALVEQVEGMPVGES